MVPRQFSGSVISRLGSTDYWMSLNPELTITERPFLRSSMPLLGHCLKDDKYVRQMKEEGYFKIDQVLPPEHVEKMARAVTRLVEKGFPPVFVYVYDEFWRVYRDLSPLLTPIFGEHYRLVTNFWAWYVPPTNKDAGFRPHRDLTGSPLPALRNDGLPWIATVWMPLSNVTTHNSCMHVLPTNKDPNLPANPESAAISQESIQDIRALPARAGSVLSWNMNVLHWGSASSEWASEPRISIAAYLKRADQEGYTSVSLEPTQMLTLDFRLGVIGMVMSHYDKDAISSERYPRQLIKFCEKYLYCETNEKRFGDQAGTELNPDTKTVEKVGRNEPCPCGSGKKYKHCHGRL